MYKLISRYKGSFLSVLFAIFLVVFTIHYMKINSSEFFFYKELSGVSEEKNTPLSQLDIFHKYQAICVLTPYAINDKKTSDADLKRIFGKIYYAPWKEEIINIYGGDSYHAPGFYLVENNAVVDSISIGALYLKLAKFNFEETKGFLSGCYKTDDVCIKKITKDDSQTIFITQCQK